MFVYTVKVKWWRIISFLLLLTVVCMGVYYLMCKLPEESGTVPPQKEQEGQVWQV